MEWGLVLSRKEEEEEVTWKGDLAYTVKKKEVTYTKIRQEALSFDQIV